jgi:DNA polymerase-4
VKLKTSGFRLVTRQAAITPATDSERELVLAAEALLHQFDLTVPMRLVGLAAFHLREAGEPVQPDLFSGEDRKREQDLQRAMDRLKDRYGEDAVRWGGECKE